MREDEKMQSVISQAGGVVLLRRNDPTKGWAEIFVELKEKYPEKTFKFIPQSYIIKKNPGYTSTHKFLETLLAIPQ